MDTYHRLSYTGEFVPNQPIKNLFVAYIFNIYIVNHHLLHSIPQAEPSSNFVSLLILTLWMYHSNYELFSEDGMLLNLFTRSPLSKNTFLITS